MSDTAMSKNREEENLRDCEEELKPLKIGSTLWKIFVRLARVSLQVSQ